MSARSKAAAASPWGFAFGPNLPFLEQVTAVIVGAFVAPELFQAFVNHLPDNTRRQLREFAAAFTNAMSDVQKGMFKRVVLGLDLQDDGKPSEYRSRKGGLIANDLTLLKAFLLSEVNVAAFLDKRLQQSALRVALQEANAGWLRLHPVDEDGSVHLGRGTARKEMRSLRRGERSVARGASSAPPPTPVALSPHLFTTPPEPPRHKRHKRFRKKRDQDAAPPAAPVANTAQLALQTEQRVLWLQLLSWKLKFNQSGYAPLVQWRDAALERICAFLATTKRPKAPNRPSYFAVANTCRSRLCLCSPQLSPTQTRALYITVLTESLNSCDTTFQELKRKAGLLRKVFNPDKCELHDLLVEAAEQLQLVQVLDLKLPHHVSYAGDAYAAFGTPSGSETASSAGTPTRFSRNGARSPNPDFDLVDSVDQSQTKLMQVIAGGRRDEDISDVSSQDEG